MRTLAEIKANVNSAIGTSDVPLLMRLSDELDELATTQSRAIAHGARGWACYCTGDYAAALEHDNNALALFHELGDRKGMATATVNIGSVCLATGDYPAALEHYNRALALFQEFGIRSGEALVMISIGLVYNGEGDYPAALEHFNNALALCHEVGDRRGVASAIGNIGDLYSNTGDHVAALEHFSNAHALFHELGDRRSVAIRSNSIGRVHLHTSDHAAALEYFNSALALFRELGDQSGVANAIVGILHAHLGNEDIVSAQKTLAELDGLPVDNPDVAVERETGRARIFVIQGDLLAAQTTLANALELASTRGLRAQHADVCKELRDLAQKRNDFAAYIEYNNEFTRITEEINGKETAQRFAMQAAERKLNAERVETAKHIAVLHSTLPKHIADRVARGEVVNDHYDNAAVLFLDIVGFTTLSSEMDAPEVVAFLERVFGMCDATMNKHALMKIKTIGDSYMAVAFESAENAAQAALELAIAITEVPVRIGIHCGPVVAGVLGKERMQYDVWGDTVNIASRMESTSEPGRIHISEAFANALRSITSDAGVALAQRVSHRGEIDIKGKGPMNTYWLEPA
ncbi:hypothetical protein BH10BAC6_BH10BAC6_05810 [soil metagenome]